MRQDSQTVFKGVTKQQENVQCIRLHKTMQGAKMASVYSYSQGQNIILCKAAKFSSSDIYPALLLETGARNQT